MKENVVCEKSFDFAVKVVRLYQGIVNEKKEFVLSKQILRSGTSIGANIEEAQGGYSNKDFAAKMSISYKEARETNYWLRLLHATDYIEEERFNSLVEDCEELQKILFRIIDSTRKK